MGVGAEQEPQGDERSLADAEAKTEVSPNVISLLDGTGSQGSAERAPPAQLGRLTFGRELTLAANQFDQRVDQLRSALGQR